MKFERRVLGFAFPQSKLESKKKKNASSDDKVFPVGLRPLRTKAVASPPPVITERIGNGRTSSKGDALSEQSDGREPQSGPPSLSASVSASPVSPQPEYAKGEADAIVDTTQGSLSSWSKAAQLSAPPYPSSPRVSEFRSQPLDSGVTTATKPAIFASTGTNAKVMSNSFSENTAHLSQGSIPLDRRVKVMVDEAYVETHSNWISEVMRTIGELSRIYRLEFGIKFNLIGVVCWSDAFPYMSDSELLFNLYNHDTEGADIVLGFVNRPVSVEALDKRYMTNFDQSRHAFGLVGTNIRFEPVFLPSALRSLGIIFGAKEVTDATTEAYRMGSWMSQATVRSDRPLWIDLPNKHRILEHKTRFSIAGVTGASRQAVPISRDKGIY